MKKILLLFLLFTSLLQISQVSTIKVKKPSEKIVGIGLCIRLFKEIDRPFATKRKLEQKDYIYNQGIGATFLIPIIHKPNFKLTGEFGGWYFWNNVTDIDALNRIYRKRSQILPFLITSEFPVIRAKNFGVSVMATAGVCYNQKIHKLSDNSIRNFPVWNSVISLTLKIGFGSKYKRPYRLFAFEYGNTYLEKKFMRTSSIEIPVLIKY